MEKEQYFKELARLKDVYTTNTNLLHIKYGMSLAQYGIGDIILDKVTNTTIRVDKIKVEMDFSTRLPIPVYMGPELKKDLTPKVNGARGTVWGEEKRAELVKAKE